MKKYFFVLGVLIASPVYAEGIKFVTLPNGGMVPCNHPYAVSAGLSCSAPVTVTDYRCDGDINLYAEPDRAAFCAARNIPKPDPVKNWQIGQKYVDPYGSKMVIIGVTRDIYNRTVVTYQYYTGFYIGVVHSFIVGVTGMPFTLLEDE